MIWESTDQFGNMYVGVSDASDWTQAAEHIRALVAELAARQDTFIVSYDTDFGDLNGPHPDQVTHVLQMPWLSGQPEAQTHIERAIEQAARDLCVTVTARPA